MHLQCLVGADELLPSASVIHARTSGGLLFGDGVAISAGDIRCDTVTTVTDTDDGDGDILDGRVDGIGGAFCEVSADPAGACVPAIDPQHATWRHVAQLGLRYLPR